MKKKLLMILVILPMLLLFSGCDSTLKNSSNILKISQTDELSIEDYLDTKTDDISSPFQGGKMYSAFKILGTDSNKIYLWMLKYEYINQSNELTNGVSLPVVLTIETKDNQIGIESHRFPKDGNEYAPSLKELFPPNIRDQISKNPNELVNELELIIEKRIQANSTN